MWPGHICRAACSRKNGAAVGKGDRYLYVARGDPRAQRQRPGVEADNPAGAQNVADDHGHRGVPDEQRPVGRPGEPTRAASGDAGDRPGGGARVRDPVHVGAGGVARVQPALGGDGEAFQHGTGDRGDQARGLALGHGGVAVAGPVVRTAVDAAAATVINIGVMRMGCLHSRRVMTLPERACWPTNESPIPRPWRNAA